VIQELIPLRSLLLHGLASFHTRRAYGKALDDFLAWYRAEPHGVFSKALVQEYRSSLEARNLAPSSLNIRLAAIRKLASEAADNGLLAPEIAAGIARVRGVRRHGVRAGNWLTREQAQALLDAPSASTRKGKRDRAILGLLIGCGLRRSEVTALEVKMLQQRENRWVVVDLVGKGNRVRTVPVPSWVKSLIDHWTAAGSITQGRLFRSLNKAGVISGDRITEKVIWWTVREYAGKIGIERLAPHDLRRTCAKLCRAGGGDIEQIQFLLGHASIQTTERYLGSRQNLAAAVNDALGIEI
jgi:integrase